MANQENNFEYKSTTFKCDKCGNFYRFNPKLCKLSCSYCDNTQELRPTYKTMERPFNRSVIEECCKWVGGKLVKCSSCAATFEVYNNNISDKCPFCGANNIINIEQVPGISPSGIIPFNLDEDTARKNFFAWLTKHNVNNKTLDILKHTMKVIGIYLPIFTFDADARCQYEMRYGTEHEREYTDSDGNKKTETYYEWHTVHGEDENHFNDIKIEASEHINLGSLFNYESYKTDDASEFDPQFLCGYQCERYSEPIEKAWSIACSTMENNFRRRAEMHHFGVDKVDYFHCDLETINETYKYILVPAYIIDYKVKDESYRAFVNGENGAVSGKRPLNAVLLAIGIIVAVIVILLIIIGIVAFIAAAH